MGDLRVTGPSVRVQKKRYEVQEIVDKIGFGPFQILVGIVAGALWSQDACLTLALSFLAPAVGKEYDLSHLEQSLLVTIFFCGVGLGSFVLGYVADRAGRRIPIVVGPLLCVMFGLFTALAPGFEYVSLAQFVVGCAIGGSTVAFSLFLEIIPSSRRGPLLILFELFWAYGDIYECAVCWIVLTYYDWRVLYVVTVIPQVLLLCACLFIPESPRFLVLRDREKQAVSVLRNIAVINRQKDCLPDPLRLIASSDDVATKPLTEVSDIKTPMYDLVANDSLVESEHKESLLVQDGGSPLMPEVLEASPRAGRKKSFKDVKGKHQGEPKRGNVFSVLFSAEYRLTSILLWINWFTVTFCYYGMVFLTPLMFSSGSGTNFLLTMLMTFAELPGLFSAFVFIDFLGRKKSISLYFFAFCVSCLIGMCFIILQDQFLDAKYVLKWFTLVFLSIGRGCIVGAFDTTYAYTPEVYPTKVRATALGICSAFCRLAGICSPFLPYLCEDVAPWLPIAMYGVMSFFCGILTFFLPVETQGRQLSDN